MTSLGASTNLKFPKAWLNRLANSGSPCVSLKKQYRKSIWSNLHNHRFAQRDCCIQRTFQRFPPGFQQTNSLQLVLYYWFYLLGEFYFYFFFFYSPLQKTRPLISLHRKGHKILFWLLFSSFYLIKLMKN